MGFFEMVGVGSIIPFLNLVSVGDVSNMDRLTRYVYEVLEPISFTNFLLVVGSTVLILLLISNLLRAIVLWSTSYFVWTNQAFMAIRLLSSILNRPYEVFSEENSAKISKDILYETERFVTGLLHPLLTIISQLVLAISIFIVLCLYDVAVAIPLTLITIILFGSFIILIHRPLHNKGIQRYKSIGEKFKMVDEALSGIKLIKFLKKESFFAEQITKSSFDFADSMSYMTIVRSLPRYIFEVLIFGSLIALSLFTIYRGGDLEEIIPIIGLFAFAGYRLLPAINQIYQSYSQFTFNSVVLEKLSSQLKQVDPEEGQIENNKSEINKIGSNFKFVFDKVSYQYKSEKSFALEETSLSIEDPGFIGIVGVTGSGKSTFLDLFIGLIKPTSGKITLNGKEFDEYGKKVLPDKIGYVPQDIYLLDDTIIKNVALGVKDEEIDMEGVKEALKISDLDDFIFKNLEKGYNTQVGERGAKLSGGQVQRIGIARALYNKPEILILDEGTSNLDQKTEAKILSNLINNQQIKLLLIVSHRLKVTEKCTELILFKDGRVFDRGTYQELEERNELFQQMIKT